MALNEAYKNRMRSWWAKRQHYENVGPESRDEWWLQAEDERANLLELPPIIVPGQRNNPTSCSTKGSTIETQPPSRDKPSNKTGGETSPGAAVPEDDEDVSSHGSSLESIDSQKSSCRSEDASSQATLWATNNTIHNQHLIQHLGFLRQKTQPREVKLVWALNQPDE